MDRQGRGRRSVILEESAIGEFEKRGYTTLKPNVDFYSAPVYSLMGIPVDLMTPIFAISRIAGWCAHILEEEFAEQGGRKYLYRLFPGGPVSQGSRIARLPLPAYSSDRSCGSVE